MKKSILLGAALMISMMGFSQVTVNVGASTTVHTTFILDQGLKTDPNYVSINSIEMAPVGFTFGVDFSKSFGLQLESIIANYQQYYQIYDQVSNTQLGELQFDLQYINIPMLMKFMSASDNRGRASFMLGPQISLLNKGTETLTLLQSAANGNLALPDVPEGTVPANIGDNGLPAGTLVTGDGTYALPGTIPEGFETDLLAANAEEQFRQWREQEIHIVAAFGFDYDLSSKIGISAVGKIDYGLSDMRNGDLLDELKAATSNSVQDLYARRANVAIGAQITLRYVFGGTRYFLKTLL